MKEVNEISKIVFKLKHWEGYTLFSIIEQEGAKSHHEIFFKGSNGWIINSFKCISIDTVQKIVQLRGYDSDLDNKVVSKEDKDKCIYNSIIEVFKELSEQGSAREPKYGDIILVRNSTDDNWEERLYITSLFDRVSNRYATIKCSEETSLRSGTYDVVLWKYMKPLNSKGSFRQINEDTFEVIF